MAYKITSTQIINNDLSFAGISTFTTTAQFIGKGSIPAGTVMIFPQANAPTGFTKLTSHDNKALRVVSGTGGGSAGTNSFTTVHSNVTIPFSGTSGSYTLLAADMAPHAHPASALQIVPGNTDRNPNSPGNGVSVAGVGIQPAGGSTGHTHPISSSSTLDLRVLYVDAIIASRDA